MCTKVGSLRVAYVLIAPAVPPHPCRKDPLTSAPLSEEHVYPNLSLYTAIEEWILANNTA